jgi:PIN domain nuclease of toxin-antitoxin system
MIVLDTHVVVWLAQEPDRLSSKAVRAIAAARKTGGVGISDVTLWELAMLVTRERIELATSLESFLRAVESTFVVFPLTAMIAQRSVQFTDRYPADPMDRIIGATALIEGVPLVTRDEKIRRSKEVPSIW